MPSPTIHGMRRVVPASQMLNAMGASLLKIKEDDGLTWGDIGAAIGKSDDQAAKYAYGEATMDALTFVRACNAWNGRFANGVMALIGQHVSPNADSIAVDQMGLIDLTKLLLELQSALADGKISEAELVNLGPFIEAAGAVIDSLRAQLAAVTSK